MSQVYATKQVVAKLAAFAQPGPYAEPRDIRPYMEEFSQFATNKLVDVDELFQAIKIEVTRRAKEAQQ